MVNILAIEALHAETSSPLHLSKSPRFDLFAPRLRNDRRYSWLWARQLMRDGKASQATLILEKAIAQQFRSPLITWDLTQVYITLGDQEKAMNTLRRLELSTNRLVSFGQKAQQEGRPDAVSVYARLATEQGGGDWFSHRWLGLWWLQQGDTARALSYLEKARHEAPEDHYTYYLLGLAYRRQGRYELSVEMWRHALAFLPQDLTYMRELAQTLLQRNEPGDHEEAVKLLEAVLNDSPQDQYAADLLKALTER